MHRLGLQSTSILAKTTTSKDSTCFKYGKMNVNIWKVPMKSNKWIQIQWNRRNESKTFIKLSISEVLDQQYFSEERLVFKRRKRIRRIWISCKYHTSVLINKTKEHLKEGESNIFLLDWTAEIDSSTESSSQEVVATLIDFLYRLSLSQPKLRFGLFELLRLIKDVRILAFRPSSACELPWQLRYKRKRQSMVRIA